MDEERDHKLPNLKICIENTESDEDKRDPVPISEDEELDYNEEIDSNASSAEDNVEFNVRLGNLQKSGSGDSRPDSKLLKTRDDSRLIKHKSESEEGEISDSSDETPVEFNVRLGKLSTHSSANKVPNRYRSQEDGLLGKNSHLKSDKARRLGMEISKRDPSIDLQELYRSLGLEENRIDEDRRGIRLEAIHFRGLKDMNTKDVFEYYREFNPGNVEWIDDQSCNVVWQDPLYTARALLRLSKSYNQVMLGDSRAEETSDTEKDKTKEPRRKKLVKKQRKNNSSSSASSSSSSSEDEEDSSMKKKGRKKLPPNQKCQDSLSSKLSVPGKEDPVPEKMEEDDDDVLDLMDEGDKREKGSKDMDVTEKNKKSDESSKKKKLSARDTKASASKERQSRKDQRSSRGQSNKARVSSSSSSSSSSGSSHGSSSSSSASSSSSSSSGSSSDSSSSSSSSSDEGKKETGLKVKTVKTVKKTKKPKPVAAAPAGRKPADIPWPPGKWRLGKPYKNSKYLFLRYAMKSDRKSSSTDKLGMMFQKNRHSSNREDRGLISKSRKESFQARQQQDQAGEAQRALSAKRSTIKYDDVEDIFGDDTVNVSMEMDEIEEFGAKPQSKKEIEERLKSILGENKPKQREPESEEEVMPPKEESDDDLDLTMDTKVPEVDEEAALMEQELDILLAEPPKKRTMRMYADDVEEERVSKRLHKRLETDDSPEYHDDRSLEPRRRKDARARISGKSVTMAIPSGGTDLRNKLKASRRTPYDKSSSYNRYQRVRVEVRD